MPKNISEIFDNIKINRYICKAGERYFDPIRNIFVCITPEETVRQKMIVYLEKQLGIEKDRIFVEDHLAHYGINNQNGRIDISILDDNDQPLAIVECKEPNVPIGGMQVLVQAIGYADAVGAHEESVIQYMKDYDAKFRILDEPLMTVGIGVAFSKNETRDLPEKLEQTMEEMREDGTSAKIIGKYLDNPEKYLEVDQLEEE